MEQSTTIKVTKSQRDFISKAAKKHTDDKNKPDPKPMGEYAFQCVKFINKNKYDPYELEDFHTAEELKKLREVVVGFHRTQEKNLIKPMIETVNGMARSQVEFSILLQEFMSMNAVLEDDTIFEEKEPVSSGTLSNSDDDKNKAEIQRLKNILAQKDMKLHSQRQALEAIKNASLPKKGQIILNMSEDEFNKVVSL
ncbi:MAG: hypothetical protein RLO12_10920 [Fulvivirga sp.]